MVGVTIGDFVLLMMHSSKNLAEGGFEVLLECSFIYPLIYLFLNLKFLGVDDVEQLVDECLMTKERMKAGRRRDIKRA